MPHIHTKPGQYDITISAYIIRRTEDGPRVLLHMHRKHHKLLPPGGHIELDETPWMALEHELREESGYELRELSVLQPRIRTDDAIYRGIAVQPVPFHVNAHSISPEHFHTDMSYALIAATVPSESPREGESQDLRWMSETDIAEMSDGTMYFNTRQTALALLRSIIDEWEPVPAEQYLGIPPV